MPKKTSGELIRISYNIDRLKELGVPKEIIDDLRAWLKKEQGR